MAGSSLTIEQTLTLLEEAPTRIAAATKGLTEAQLHRAPERGEWSVNEVLAHVRACADVRGESIRTIVAEDHPTIRAVNPRTWIKKTDYLDLEFKSSFRAFTKQRADLLALLTSLPRKSWSRGATVTGAGAVLERTVLFYAEWVAIHERPHVKQVERIVKKMHAVTDSFRRTVIRTGLTELLAIRHPIVLGGMSGGTSAELVAAVSGAGGFGIYGRVVHRGERCRSDR